MTATTPITICEFCAQPMTPQTPCTLATYRLNHQDFRRIPYGAPEEGWSDGMNPHGDQTTPARTCHDCATQPGQFHHPGCDVERCPRCLGQYISCDCEPPQGINFFCPHCEQEVLDEDAHTLFPHTVISTPPLHCPVCERDWLTTFHEAAPKGTPPHAIIPINHCQPKGPQRR